MPRDARQPGARQREDVRGDDDVQEVGAELRRLVDRLRPEARQRVDDERRGEHECEAVGRRQRPQQRSQSWPVFPEEAECDRERGGQGEREGGEELGREPELPGEHRSEPPGEAPRVQLAADVDHDHERDERQQEDGRHVRMTE